MCLCIDIMHACMYLCMYECILLYVCIHVCIRTVCTYMYICKLYVHLYIVYVSMCVCMHNLMSGAPIGYVCDVIMKVFHVCTYTGGLVRLGYVQCMYVCIKMYIITTMNVPYLAII